jgi:thiamine pyrophosphokinase
LLSKRVVIFANGQLPDLNMAHAILNSDDFIIGADGGTRHVLALGRIPQVVIGDLDSITTEAHQKLKKTNVEIIQFPRDKNETDLELAVRHAVTLKPSQIIIVAALGDRLDQTLGNLALIADPHLSAFDIRLDDGVEEVFICRDHIQVHGKCGDIVSLIPWQGDVAGVITNGLKWPLHDEFLYSNKTRGISNEMTAEIAEVQISSGLLLVVHARFIRN